ncbi:MAG: DUF4419 domain-containing protein [Cyanobacteria bacterium SZAS-4]|nr:DUF4419 domain-containing protein [Cyanobacteria bacterium SZAS-4]
MKLKPSAGVTFRVHDVDTVRTSLEKWKTRDSIQRILINVQQTVGEPVLACSGYNSEVVANTQYHALIGAVHIAFAEHRPLVLSPDAIWITILQGLAMHVHIYAEELRSTFVSHDGRKPIVVDSNIDTDSPESAWEWVINEFAERLGDQVVGSSTLVSDFSTTGVVEKLVSQVCLLDVFESYFEYILYSGCGFPEITLTGSEDDWMRLRQKIELLQPFKVDLWLPHLREIADHFCMAMRGEADISYWQDMYKQTNNYGYDLVNGWILKLIPYLQNQVTGTWDVLNPLLCDPERYPASLYGAKTDQLPSGMSVVPLTVIDKRTMLKRRMEIIGGFVGIEQDPDTFAVQPKIGWAIRKAKDSKWQFLEDAPQIQKRPALSLSNFSAVISMLQEKVRYRAQMPGEFIEFYKQYDGLSIEDRSGIIWTMRPFSEVEVAGDRVYEVNQTPNEVSSKVASYDDVIFVNPYRAWHIADGSDGSKVLYSAQQYDRGLFEVRVVNSQGASNVSYLGLRDFLSHLIENAIEIREE